MAGFLGNEAALQCPVLIEASGCHELGAEHLEGTGVKLAGARDLRSQYRQASHISVVEDLHDVGLVVAPAEVAFVDHESASERFENVENRRDRGGSACEDWLVAKGADHEQEARLTTPVVAPHT